MSKLLRQRWGLSRPPDVPFTINRASPQAAGIRVWSPFLGSRGSGVVRDLSGYGSHGTLTNSAHWASDPKFGHVIHCDEGNSDYVTWGTGIFAADIDFTVAVWLKTTDTYDKLLGCYGPASWNGSWVINSRGAVGGVRFTVDSLSAAAVYTDGTIKTQDGLWHHVVCLRRGGTPEIYVDGVFDASGAACGGAFTAGNAVTFGGVLWGPAYATVEGFDFRIYNRAVIPSVIRQMSDPPTLWELYKPQMRQYLAMSPAAPPPTAALPIFPPPDAVHSLVFGGVTVR